MQSTLNASDSDPWNQIAPLLDEALNCLGKKEHDAVVLRYFEGKDLKQVGASLGMREDAARMRVNRAVEKLRQFFNRRGVTLSAAAIAGAVSANSVQAAPGGLAAAITAAALYVSNLPMTNGGYEKAAADYSRFLEIKPNDCSARHNRALYYEQLGQFDNAIADYTTLIEGGTDFSRVGNKDKQLALDYHYRGRAYQWYKRDYAKAVADYNEALRLDPNIDGVHLHRGQCYEALGQADMAQQVFAIEPPH